jgi:hypothetical protein
MLRPAYSQLVISTYKNLSGTWNKYTKKYTYGEPREIDIVFKVYKTHITVSDRAGSVYKLVQSKDDIVDSDCTIVGFDCVDEKNRRCDVSLFKYNDPSRANMIAVIYEEMAFMYFISGIENLN